MANEEHLAILRQGVDVWNRWTDRRFGFRPDLREADLHGMYLRGADFAEADLRSTRLSEADLFSADFFGADLTDADMTSTYLREARLIGADLIGVDLTGAEFIEANLSGANLNQARLFYTVFANTDLSHVKGLDTVFHEGPSTIGIDTLYRSGGDIPESFLRGCGVPDQFIEYARSLVGKAIEYYSCFISHSAKDKDFCERLCADLQANHVRVWYFPEDAKWGEPVWGEIDRSIRVYDKLIVVCSENSLQSGPVNREIERALQREDQEDKNVLFPIRIDGYVFDTWQHPRKADIVTKVVGDFEGWDRDAAKYRKSLERLLEALGK